MRLIDADALERVLDMIPCADIKNMDGQAYVLVRLSQVYNVIKNAPTIEPEQLQDNCEGCYYKDGMGYQCDSCARFFPDRYSQER